jgi:hypothetical protein
VLIVCAASLINEGSMKGVLSLPLPLPKSKSLIESITAFVASSTLRSTAK